MMRRGDKPLCGLIPPLRAGAGFTLIELLIAASIFALVASALYFTFSSGIAVWKRLEASGELYQSVRFCLDRLSSELRQAVASSDEENFIASSGSLEFFTASEMHTSYREGRHLKKIKYKFDGSKGTLYRREMPLEEVLKEAAPSEEEGHGEEAVGEEEAGDKVLSGIESFLLSYAYYDEESGEIQWRESWESAQDIPSSVKVVLSAESTAGGMEEFRKTINIFTGTLGEEPKEEAGKQGE